MLPTHSETSDLYFHNVPITFYKGRNSDLLYEHGIYSLYDCCDRYRTNEIYIRTDWNIREVQI